MKANGFAGEKMSSESSACHVDRSEKATEMPLSTGLGMGFAQESTNVRSPKDWKERLQKSISAGWILVSQPSLCIIWAIKVWPDGRPGRDSSVQSRSWEAMRVSKCQVC